LASEDETDSLSRNACKKLRNPNSFGFSASEDEVDRLSRNAGKKFRNPNPFGFSASEDETDRLCRNAGKKLRNPSPFGFSASEDETDKFPETLARNDHYSVRNKPENRSSEHQNFITNWLLCLLLWQ